MKPTIKELQDKLDRAIEASRSKIDEINDDMPAERRAEVNAEADRILDEVRDIEKDIERRQAVEAAEARRAAARDEAEQRARENRRPGAGEGAAPGAGEGGKVSYRDAFVEMIRCCGNVSAMTPEAREALEAGRREVEARAQTSGANAGGGFTVPDEMMAGLVRTMSDWGPMYDDEGLCTVINTDGGAELPIPTTDDTGSTAEAHTEGAELTDDGGKDVTFGQKTLGGFEFDTEWLRISKALLDDSSLAILQVIEALLGERLGRIANARLTVGTGTGQPNGVVTASALGVTAAGTAAIVADELLDLEHSVNAAYRRSPRAGFMFADTTLKAIRKLKDGQGNYLWQRGNIQDGVPPTLNDTRYWINDDVPAIATGQKALLYGDFSKYYVRKVGAPLVGSLTDSKFWPGAGVAGYIRFDGELGDSAAIKHLILA